MRYPTPVKLKEYREEIKMTSSKIIVLDQNRASGCRPYRQSAASHKNMQLSRLLCVTELVVTALIGAGFCFCVGLVITML